MIYICVLAALTNFDPTPGCQLNENVKSNQLSTLTDQMRIPMLSVKIALNKNIISSISDSSSRNFFSVTMYLEFTIKGFDISLSALAAATIFLTQH